MKGRTAPVRFAAVGRCYKPRPASLVLTRPPPPPMPARVDAYPMAAPSVFLHLYYNFFFLLTLLLLHRHRRDSYDISHRRPSPPPIATLNPSPSPSIIQDRSAMSTPPARRTPPQPLPSGLHSSSYYSHDPVILHPRHQPVPHFQSRPDSMTHSYGFSAHPSFDHRYDHPDGSNHSSYHNSVPIPSHAPIHPVSHIPSSHVRETYTHPYPLPGQAVASIYTDDANTKLSDRVRRRCFNCCTTDTSTWRRSNLSPGKVVSVLPLSLFLPLIFPLSSCVTSVVCSNGLILGPGPNNSLTNVALSLVPLSAGPERLQRTSYLPFRPHTTITPIPPLPPYRTTIRGGIIN